MTPKRILFVEDNPVYIRAGLDYMLQHHNVNVTPAQDFTSAKSVLDTQHIDGAIVDCFFPSGYSCDPSHVDLGMQVIHRLREQRTSNPLENSLTQVEKLLGEDFARLAAKNAGVPYEQASDPIYRLEKAMKQDARQQPLGILVGELLEKQGVPFVLATSTYHHDKLVGPLFEYARKHGWSIIDCPHNQPEQKATKEFWKEVYETLLEKME